LAVNEATRNAPKLAAQHSLATPQPQNHYLQYHALDLKTIISSITESFDEGP